MVHYIFKGSDVGIIFSEIFDTKFCLLFAIILPMPCLLAQQLECWIGRLTAVIIGSILKHDGATYF